MRPGQNVAYPDARYKYRKHMKKHLNGENFIASNIWLNRKKGRVLYGGDHHREEACRRAVNGRSESVNFLAVSTTLTEKS